VRALLLALARAAPPYPCASSLCRLLLSDSSGSFGASVTPELALVVAIPELAPGRSGTSLSLVDRSASVYGARYVYTPLRGKPDAAALGYPSGAFSLSSKSCS
jgi:ribosomal protein S12 methylthiotransferase accessory factor YcaO